MSPTPSRRTLAVRLLLAIAGLIAAGGAHAQYKWTGADGQTGYGDQPPRDATHVERLDGLAAVPPADAMAALPFEIRRAARDFPVVLYGRNDCPPCEEARNFLRARSVPYTERTVITHEDVEAFRQLGGADRLPAMAIGRQFLRGFDPPSWGDALDGAGYPKGIPLPATWQWPAPAPLAPPAPRPPADAGEPR